MKCLGFGPDEDQSSGTLWLELVPKILDHVVRANISFDRVSVTDAESESTPIEKRSDRVDVLAELSEAHYAFSTIKCLCMKGIDDKFGQYCGRNYCASVWNAPSNG